MKYTQEENVVFTQGGDEMEVDLLKIEEGKEEEEEEKEFKIAMIVHWKDRKVHWKDRKVHLKDRKVQVKERKRKRDSAGRSLLRLSLM